MTRSKRLAAYLRWAGQQKLEYGSWDCLIGFVAEWVIRERGIDPALPWRETYSTELGCARLLRREGGMLAIMSKAAADFEVTPTPRIGDVGLITARTAKGDQDMGAICTGMSWAILATGGIGLIKTTPLAAWTI